MRVLIWDFDGVIADSIKECFVIAKEVIEKNKDLGGFVRNPKPFTLEEFRHYRRHAVIGRDFFTNFLLERNFGGFSKETGELLEKQNSRLLNGLDSEFYVERERLIREENGRWLSLIALYSGIPDAVRDLRGRGIKNVVMSARESASIKLFLEKNGLSECFEFIAGREVCPHEKSLKARQAALIAERYPSAELYFVDDMAYNLDLVARLTPVKLIFASWGYGGWSGSLDALKAGSPEEMLDFFSE